ERRLLLRLLRLFLSGGCRTRRLASPAPTARAACSRGADRRYPGRLPGQCRPEPGLWLAQRQERHHGAPSLHFRGSVWPEDGPDAAAAAPPPLVRACQYQGAIRRTAATERVQHRHPRHGWYHWFRAPAGESVAEILCLPDRPAGFFRALWGNPGARRARPDER